MSKLLKILIIAVAGIVVLAVGLVVVLLTVIDPNRYRSALENTVAQQSGLQLQIAGDMGWTFRPVFGLSIQDVRLRNPDSPQELASFSTISLRVDPAGLFRSELNIEEFLAENLHINWIVDSQGQSNWPAAGSDNAAVVVEPGSAELPIAVNIRQIRISNASLSVQNLQNGTNMTVQNINLVSSDTNLENRPFALSLLMELVDYAGNGNLSLAMETTAKVDYNAATLALDALKLDLSPLSLSGNLAVTNFLTDPSWNVNLRSNTFPLPHLLANFVSSDESALPPPNQQQLTIHQLMANGDASGLRLETLELGLGGAQEDRVSLEGDINYAQTNRPLRIGYELSSAALDLDAWLPPAPEVTEEDPAEPAPDIELPMDLLRSMNVRGAHSINSLTLAGLQFSPLQFGLVLENGQLNLDTQSVGFYGGDLDMTVRLNARNSPAQLAMTSELSNINAATLSADMPRLNFFTGRFDLNTTHVMSGNSVNALMDSITGSSRVQLSESSVNIAMLKQVFSAISVLSPSGDMASAWPDVVQINNTEAVLNFSNGINSGQEFAMRLDNFDIAGTGGINLQEGSFDYQLAFTVLGEPAPQSIRVNENYQNVAWPIRCDAAFTDSPVRYCSPDLQRVREVFAQIARGEIERRATDVIGEQVDRVRDRLRNLLPTP
ncbi:MAG: AsmA family protein [Pseudohongiella sp.]|nr:AsmA family protein [Pseudohongiella sp.]